MRREKCEPVDHLNVLIVDDEEAIRITLSSFLRAFGHKVMTVPCGYSALDELKRNTYDVIILDMNMPELDGYETLQKINELFSESGLYTPAVVIYTGYSQEGRVQNCTALGAHKVLNKPSKTQKILETLTEAVDQKRRMQSG